MFALFKILTTEDLIWRKSKETQHFESNPVSLTSIPSPRAATLGLATPNKAPSPPKLKHETLQISVDFVNF